MLDLPHSIEVCAFEDSAMKHSDLTRIFDLVRDTKITVLAISTDTSQFEKNGWADTFGQLPRGLEHLFLEFDSCYEYENQSANDSNTEHVCDSAFLARLRSVIHKDTEIHLLKEGGSKNMFGNWDLRYPLSFKLSRWLSS
jgi:hypothetical protein